MQIVGVGLNIANETRSFSLATFQHQTHTDWLLHMRPLLAFIVRQQLTICVTAEYCQISAFFQLTDSVGNGFFRWSSSIGIMHLSYIAAKVLLNQVKVVGNLQLMPTKQISGKYFILISCYILNQKCEKTEFACKRKINAATIFIHPNLIKRNT